MDAKIKQIIAGIRAVEGDALTNDPNDSGGWTKYGITEATAREYGFDVKQLTWEQAEGIYYDKYVKKPKFDLVLPIMPRVAVELIDTTVNGGSPVVWLQQWLNVLNYNNCLSPAPLKEDGLLGSNTLDALRALCKQRGADVADDVLTTALNCDQGVYYKSLATRRPKDKKFAYGWLLNRVHNQIKQ